jgi:uncharacterized membrane protein
MVLLIIALPGGITSAFELFFLAIVISGLLSLPCLLLLYLACKYIVKYAGNTTTFKLLLTLAGVVLTYVPFWIIDDFNPLLDKDLLSQSLFISYCVLIVAGIWLYKLKPVSSYLQSNQTNEVGPYI